MPAPNVTSPIPPGSAAGRLRVAATSPAGSPRAGSAARARNAAAARRTRVARTRILRAALIRARIVCARATRTCVGRPSVCVAAGSEAALSGFARFTPFSDATAARGTGRRMLVVAARGQSGAGATAAQSQD